MCPGATASEGSAIKRAKTGSSDVPVGLVTPAVVVGGGWLGREGGGGVCGCGWAPRGQVSLRFPLGIARAGRGLQGGHVAPNPGLGGRAMRPRARSVAIARLPGAAKGREAAVHRRRQISRRERMLAPPSMPRQPPTTGGQGGGTPGGTRRAPSPEPPTNPRKTSRAPKRRERAPVDGAFRRKGRWRSQTAQPPVRLRRFATFWPSPHVPVRGCAPLIRGCARRTLPGCSRRYGRA